MSKLELKIPPVAVAFIAAVLMWLVALVFPTIAMATALKTFLCLCLLVVGLIFGVGGVLAFNKAQTTVNPMTPQDASKLVIMGVYKRTRNPMYVGLLLLLIAWGVYLASIFAAVVVIGFVIYMTAFQIKPEERALKARFGADYLDYLERVRRWL